MTPLQTLDSAVARSVDGSKQQVAISMAWWNEETLAGFSEITGHQSHTAAHIMYAALIGAGERQWLFPAGV